MGQTAGKINGHFLLIESQVFASHNVLFSKLLVVVVVVVAAAAAVVVVVVVAETVEELDLSRFSDFFQTRARGPSRLLFSEPFFRKGMR